MELYHSTEQPLNVNRWPTLRNFYQPLSSGHLGRSRRCPLNRGFTVAGNFFPMARALFGYFQVTWQLTIKLFPVKISERPTFQNLWRQRVAVHPRRRRCPLNRGFTVAGNFFPMARALFGYFQVTWQLTMKVFPAKISEQATLQNLWRQMVTVHPRMLTDNPL